jgi:hypothetical protein
VLTFEFRALYKVVILVNRVVDRTFRVSAIAYRVLRIVFGVRHLNMGP